MHTHQSSAKADDCGYARPLCPIKKKKNERIRTSRIPDELRKSKIKF